MDGYTQDVRLSFTAIGIYTSMLHFPERRYDEAAILASDVLTDDGVLMQSLDQLRGAGYIDRVEGLWVVTP